MRLRHYNILLFLLVLLASCANRGIGPQGGPKDSIPPKVLRVEPENGAVNYTGKTVTIHFDEYVQARQCLATPAHLSASEAAA